MKKIIIFSTTYAPYIGGSEIAIKEITNRIDDKEFEMLTPRFDRRLPKVEKIGNILVRRFGFGNRFDKYLFVVFGGLYASLLHRKKAYDGAWCMEANYAGGACYWFYRFSKVHYLLSLQQGDPLEQIEHRVRFVRGFFVDLFAKASYLQAISTYLLDWGVRSGFWREDKKIVPNGVDINRFTVHFSHEEIEETRRSFSFPSNSFLLVTVSRLVKKNGISDVVKAMRHLPKNVCFVICGTGELEGDIKKFIKDYDLTGRVVFLGNVSHDELPRILKSCDAFIRPALTEGLGNAFLEAMASQIVTIGTLVGGITDFLDDEVNGFVVEPNDPESIVEIVKKIMVLDKEDRVLITTTARNTVEQDYNWKNIALDMNNILDNVCE